MLARVFRLGMPIGLTTLCESGLFAAAALMMGWLGTIPLAAHGIAVQLASITFMVHLGFSNVATIRVGNAYGRRDIPHMSRGSLMVTLLSFGFSALTMIVFVLWPEPLIFFFMREGETARAEILAIGVGLLAMAALFQLVDGAQAVARYQDPDDLCSHQLLAGRHSVFLRAGLCAGLGGHWHLGRFGHWAGLCRGPAEHALLGQHHQRIGRVHGMKRYGRSPWVSQLTSRRWQRSGPKRPSSRQIQRRWGQ
jgi:MATE family multidrug resistance protein